MTTNDRPTEEAPIVKTLDYIRIASTWGPRQLLWGCPTAVTNVYTIETIPRDDVGINFGDDVYLDPAKDDQPPTVAYIWRYSGNRTLPVQVIPAYADVMVEAIKRLDFACEVYHGINSKVTSISINVPSHIALDLLYDLLIKQPTRRFIIDAGWFAFGVEDDDE